ncbi:MAG: DUF2214 family protein [Pseudanabaenaceae cyanobacterium]
MWDSTVASAVTAWAHYFSYATMAAALTIEHLTLKPEPTVKEGWRLVVADSIYGVAAITVLATGVLRLLYFAKGSEYYMHQPLFWVKVSLYGVVGVLSIYPTVSFLSWIGGLRADKAPALAAGRAKLLQWLVRGELLGMALIPLMASLMARGVGSNWFAA